MNSSSVKECYYSNVFNRDFILSFHHPHSGTSNRCGKFNIEIMSSDVCLATQSAMGEKKFDKNTSPDSASVFTFDLQETLHAPYLTTKLTLSLDKPKCSCGMNLRVGVHRKLVPPSQIRDYVPPIFHEFCDSIPHSQTAVSAGARRGSGEKKRTGSKKGTRTGSLKNAHRNGTSSRVLP
ncbi:hypothetical protein PR048_003242 [Dryococelus australis]|uniref:Uncharacterized protein n=1 Tax=Dryococelus australis TaxID=614101 RepID=A0ABQ9IMG3_9NEOP|nr:hypothetical protein PR048_003242 [Dryococelus australis]